MPWQGLENLGDREVWTVMPLILPSHVWHGSNAKQNWAKKPLGYFRFAEPKSKMS